MVRGKRKEWWQHTASLMALIHNVNCLKESDQRTPLDFYPFNDEPAPEPKAEFVAPISILKTVFVDR